MEYIEQNRTTSNKIEQNRTSRRIKFDIGSVIVRTEKFGFDFVRLQNIIEFNRSITFDCLPRDHGRFQDERKTTCQRVDAKNHKRLVCDICYDVTHARWSKSTLNLKSCPTNLQCQ